MTRSRPEREGGQTPSQTLGPFFHQGLLRVRGNFQVPGVCTAERDLFDEHAVPAGAPGQRLALSGRVLDGRGEPITDALIEVWQADAEGRYPRARGPGSSLRGSPPDESTFGFARVATDESGRYRVVTVKPGCVAGPGAPSAPHLGLLLGARGMMRHVYTRVYFEGDAELSADPVLERVPAHRRHTLIARRGESAGGVDQFHLDLRVQGPEETVFFEV